MTASLNGQVSYSRRPWDEHNCKASAGQLLCKNKNKHRQFAAESLENDRNLKHSNISKLKLISKSKGYLLQTIKLWEKLIVYLTEKRIRR